MLIKAVNNKYIHQWLELAKELEPVFQAPMAGVPSFREFIQSKIENQEAFMALDRKEALSLMGIIAFSRKSNRISWFGVFGKYRGKGAGSKLLECALSHLDFTRDIEVITFRENNPDSLPALAIYKKYGFEVVDENYLWEGQKRCLMRKSPR
ncbi:MAG: GNAT family N-acetyltransferase [Spirochaetales bacterium]|nr:GNAT family N-acetyltransferase [Spirochaetales bacterium]